MGFKLLGVFCEYHCSTALITVLTCLRRERVPPLISDVNHCGEFSARWTTNNQTAHAFQVVCAFAAPVAIQGLLRYGFRNYYYLCCVVLGSKMLTSCPAISSQGEKLTAFSHGFGSRCCSLGASAGASLTSGSCSSRYSTPSVDLPALMVN